jgi:hypothetical protein
MKNHTLAGIRDHPETGRNPFLDTPQPTRRIDFQGLRINSTTSVSGYRLTMLATDFQLYAFFLPNHVRGRV